MFNVLLVDNSDLKKISIDVNKVFLHGWIWNMVKSQLFDKVFDYLEQGTLQKGTRVICKTNTSYLLVININGRLQQIKYLRY